MGSVRQLVLWVVIAAATSALLGGVLFWERGRASARWSALPIGSPRAGAELFQKKGCAHCHAVKGLGGTFGPDLGSAGTSRSHPDQLVVAMWNHAPRMWKRMQAERLDYPRLDDQEMADVFAYLFVARHGDEAGDAARGRQLYETKGCTRCHGASNTNTTGGDRALGKSASPVEWARAMWNHPPVTEVGGEPPTFEGREMNDLLAYARGASVPGPDRLLLAADPDRGWKLFRDRSCVACHSVKDETGKVGPQLGPGCELPATIVQLAGTLWNHSEAMSRAMRERGVTRPSFDGQEMADLVAFLYSVRTAEPGGSPRLGEVLYAGRGCDRCHGVRAAGTERGPGLRGRGKTFTSISFAAALWRHGRVYGRTREDGQGWPELSEGDVGDLITYLNSSATARP
jgi:mono/diheme cytochrome c family protein